MTYSKGARVEREFMEKLNSYGFLTVRVAGSGKHGPDVLAFKGHRAYAFEIKAVDSDYLWIRQEQLDAIKDWNEKAGIEFFIAWKKEKKFYLIRPEELEGKSGIPFSRAKLIGRDFYYLVRE
ncbi:MAG: hypothetical protein QW035_00870 [Candidatus Anstonellales archaeon]